MTSGSIYSKFPFDGLIYAPIPNIAPTLAIGPIHPPNIPSDPTKNYKNLGTIWSTSVNVSVLVSV